MVKYEMTDKTSVCLKVDRIRHRRKSSAMCGTYHISLLDLKQRMMGARDSNGFLKHYRYVMSCNLGVT